jgi:hypothetical protein
LTDSLVEENKLETKYLVFVILGIALMVVGTSQLILANNNWTAQTENTKALLSTNYPLVQAVQATFHIVISGMLLVLGAICLACVAILNDW